MIIYAADDEMYMLEALIDSVRSILPQADIKGFRASKDVLAAMQQNPCDVAFLDIRMPGLDGLELARELIAIKEDMDVVFVTGYDEYKADAMDVYASAYIMKPVTPEKVQESVKHIRYPIRKGKHNYHAIAFGNFALYVDDEPVNFHRNKSAELLAYLVDRGGSIVTRQELTLVLFSDETHSRRAQQHLNNAVQTLLKDLKSVDAEELLYRGSNGMAINRSLLNADVYKYLAGDKSLYNGLYMEQYSWGDYFKTDRNF